jgi:PAS domain S-box-containing protein
MSSHFEELVVLAIMSILVMLFAWIYVRDPQRTSRLWMWGWVAICGHFAAPLLAAWLSQPSLLVEWIRIATLEIAGTLFLLSVSGILMASSRWLAAYLGFITSFSLLYLTFLLLDTRYSWIYPVFLALSMATNIVLVIRNFGYRSRFFWATALVILPYGGVALWDSVRRNPETGLMFYLSTYFAITGIAYWRKFSRYTPGVVFTSLSFLAWGLVWPIGAMLGPHGPHPSSFFWDLPKYFVAFGMIMTLSETHAENATNAAHEYEALFEENLAAVCVSTPEGQLLDCNSAFLKMYGFKTKAEARANPTVDLFATLADRDFFMENLEASGTLLDYECHQRKSDGSLFWTLERSTLRTYLERRLIQRTLIDITERRQSEMALRDSEERFATIFRESPIACAIVSMDGVFLDANQTLTRMLRRPLEDVIGKSAVELGLWRSHAEREQFFERLRVEGSVQNLDMDFKDNEGNRHIGVYYATAIRIGDKDCILGMQLDQTDQRELEAKYLQSQKMEALGRLAGGIAHDFNNMLGIIGGFAELLVARSNQDEISKRYCTRISQAASRANGLTRQLLTFSRREIIRPCPLQPARVVRDLESILPRIMGEDIELSLELHAKGTVIIDPTQFEQIIYNLIANARDAMPKGGHLSIQMEDISRLPLPPSRGNGAGRYVAIRVRDSGVGMDEATRQHAFEPFFTTKGVGQGTGLGLATVYAIVQECSGDISIDSHPGQGTQITILLPSTNHSEPRVVRRPLQELRKDTGSILLVEDQPELCEASADFLRSVGYSVICASSGAEALERAHNAERIDLVISDVVMPKMNGREMVERLLEFRPATRVLFISGYADDVVLRAGIWSEGTPFLQKPFSLDQLGRKVHELLAAKV